MSWSISVAIASRATGSDESELPCTSSSLTCASESVICENACSEVSCQPIVSCTLRWYCCVPSSDSRSCSARAALNGSSDGRVISRLEESLACVRVSAPLTRLRSDSTLRCVMPVVMRVLTARPVPCG